jgi:hypothetical protein
MIDNGSIEELDVREVAKPTPIETKVKNKSTKKPDFDWL